MAEGQHKVLRETGWVSKIVTNMSKAKTEAAYARW